jgi:hypothetical protein
MSNDTFADLEHLASKVATLERLAAAQRITVASVEEHARRILLVVGAADAMLAKTRRNEWDA